MEQNEVPLAKKLQAPKHGESFLQKEMVAGQARLIGIGSFVAKSSSKIEGGKTNHQMSDDDLCYYLRILTGN